MREVVNNNDVNIARRQLHACAVQQLQPHVEHCLRGVTFHFLGHPVVSAMLSAAGISWMDVSLHVDKDNIISFWHDGGLALGGDDRDTATTQWLLEDCQKLPHILHHSVLLNQMGWENYMAQWSIEEGSKWLDPSQVNSVNVGTLQIFLKGEIFEQLEALDTVFNESDNEQTILATIRDVADDSPISQTLDEARKIVQFVIDSVPKHSSGTLEDQADNAADDICDIGLSPIDFEVTACVDSCSTAPLFEETTVCGNADIDGDGCLTCRDVALRVPELVVGIDEIWDHTVGVVRDYGCGQVAAGRKRFACERCNLPNSVNARAAFGDNVIDATNAAGHVVAGVSDADVGDVGATFQMGSDFVGTVDGLTSGSLIDGIDWFTDRLKCPSRKRQIDNDEVRPMCVCYTKHYVFFFWYCFV